MSDERLIEVLWNLSDSFSSIVLKNMRSGTPQPDRKMSRISKYVQNLENFTQKLRSRNDAFRTTDPSVQRRLREASGNFHLLIYELSCQTERVFKLHIT